MSKDLLGPYKMFRDIGHVQYYEKKTKNNFFTGKTVFFFESLYFQNLLRCYKNDLITSTAIVGILLHPHKLSPEVCYFR